MAETLDLCGDSLIAAPIRHSVSTIGGSLVIKAGRQTRR